MDNVQTILQHYIDKFPKLVFQNSNYEEMGKADKESLSKQIAEINGILSKEVRGFVSFQNFKRDKEGKILVRYQARYSEHFVGVVYTYLSEF